MRANVCVSCAQNARNAAVGTAAVVSLRTFESAQQHNWLVFPEITAPQAGHETRYAVVLHQ